MQLPKSSELNTNILGQIFNNTSATYKFYWFVSILNIYVRDNKEEISINDIIIEMISEAWYPIHYFHLSFGKSDSFVDQILKIHKELNIPIDASKKEIKETILIKDINQSYLKVFKLNVPYRFLSPWIKYTNDNKIISESQHYTNNCLYAIIDNSIIINPSWIEYLINNYTILRDFTYWNLTNFVQKRNPNVPDISSKLVKPITREPLIQQHKFWNTYIDLNGSFSCIFSGQNLHKKEYALDHFIPWSFVSHNLLWNLIPINPSLNSSKSNNLPSLDKYLKPFALKQLEAFKLLYYHNPNWKLLEDYLTLHYSLSDLLNLSDEDFISLYIKTISPLAQIAENMGFKYWDK